MGQGEALWGRVRRCPPVPADGPWILPQDWPRQWKARLKRSPADLSLVTGLFSCLLRYCGAGRGSARSRGGAAACRCPPSPHPSASSFPEHPIAQLLRKLQCAVYTRLYPAVSQSSPEAAPAAPAGLAFLSLDAGGPLPAEPGGRRLRASRSLHCMFSVPEHGPAELRHSLSSAPLADGSPDAPGTEGDPQAPRESSFEDLERFLASPEDWPLGEPPAGPGQAASLQEQLKGVVRDIHNAIGEGGMGARGRGTGSRRAQPSELRNSLLPRQAAVPDPAGLRGAEHRRRQGPVPGLHRGGLLPPALGPAAGPLQVPQPRGSAGGSCPGPPAPAAPRCLPAGACTGPARRPWPAAWSGTATPAPPSWGCPPGSSPPHPARPPPTAPPWRTCASSRWRRVPAGSWTASVRGRAGGVLGGVWGAVGTPLSTLPCAAVRALRSICECAEEYCSARDSRAPASGTM